MSDIVFSARSKKKEYKSKGVYHSNIKLASILKEDIINNLLNGTEPEEVVDFCCGSGNLLKVFECSRFGCDCEKEFIDYCCAELEGEYKTLDFLSDPNPFGKDFDCIVGNPPFSMRNKDLAEISYKICKERFDDLPVFSNVLDYAFLIKNIFHLKADGVMSIIMFPGILYRGHKERELRRWLVEKGWIKTITFLSGKYFDDTNINICLLSIDMRKTDKNIHFDFRNSDVAYKKMVSYEEIAANNFSLSVELYLDFKKEKEPFDPIANMRFLSECMVKKIDKHLKLCAFTDSIENTNIRIEFIKQLQDLYKTDEGSNARYITGIDLFCGIGGFHYAAKENGITIAFASEIDKHAREQYKLNLGLEPFGDITKIDVEDIPDHDILFAGFPCQAFSIAGNKKGFEDTRGTLFFEIARILRFKKPNYFLLENKKGLISHDAGNTLKTIENVLLDLGYYIKIKVLNAKYFGVPQNRERLFIVGFKDKEEYFRFRFPDNQFVTGLFKTNSQGNHGYNPLFASITSPEEHEVPSANKGLYEIGDNIRKLTPRECARLQGFPESYQIVCPDNQAYKQFNNSVAIPCVSAIIKELLKIIKMR